MDGFCLKAGIHGMSPPITVVGPGSLDIRTCVSATASVGRDPSSISVEKRSGPSWGFSFRHPLRLLRLGNGGKTMHEATLASDDAVSVEQVKEDEKEHMIEEDNVVQDENWVFKILHVRSMWKKEESGEKRLEEVEEISKDVGESSSGCCADEGNEECEGCSVDDGEKVVFDRDSFSKLLRRVPLAEARLYAKLSYLGNLAYSIPHIKPANLLRSHGLRFVTSSLEKKEQAQTDDSGKPSSEDAGEDNKAIPEEACKDIEEAQSTVDNQTKETLPVDNEQLQGHQISASAAYQIAASAASYLNHHTKSMLPLIFSKSEHNEEASDGNCAEKESGSTMNEEVASLKATTDSVTAVVSAKEEVKQAVADDLNSTNSSPCEWYACDDEQSGTRFFVIQGSESLASWQANLLFEPVPFEGFDVLVHRGIYEAAKGIYQQMLPEVRKHLEYNGNRATFRFTGHSLGGSLSLLINLMLLIRGDVPSSSLLPVITFGAPTVMCGGNLLLQKLGLPQSHVKAIAMHRDIVPRAFSCHYPNHVAEFLKVLNGSFRTLPCLSKKNLLYAPMGDLLILQPEDKFSPSHDLLPSGSGLYLLSCEADDVWDGTRQIEAARAVFLNSPHPLEILSDRGAYGAGGHIQRDHDMSSYLKSVRSVIRQELSRLRKAKRQVRRRVWWPLVASGGTNPGIAPESYVASAKMMQEQLNLSGMLQSGKESLKRFGRVVTSQHIHLLVVVLLPARLLILGASRII